jgi:hypothetical protein
VSKNEDREFRLRPRKPPVSNGHSEGAAWSMAFKAVIHQARMSGTRKTSGARRASPNRKSFQQRCAVRVTYSRNSAKGQWRAHGRYVARDSAARQERADSAGLNDRSEALEMTAILDGWQTAGGERMWKLIVSPEFGDKVRPSKADP